MSEMSTCYHTNIKNEMFRLNIPQALGAKLLGIRRSWFNQILNRRVPRKLERDEVELLCKKFGFSRRKIRF